MNDQSSLPVKRGDSFDIGQLKNAGVTNPDQQNQLGEILKKPTEFAQMLGLNDEQVQNVKSIIVAGGAGVLHKKLAPLIGDELAGGAGGALAAFLAKKLLGGS